jgi:hypothetical protein
MYVKGQSHDNYGGSQEVPYNGVMPTTWANFDHFDLINLKVLSNEN